jgi:hypothetical protein
VPEATLPLLVAWESFYVIVGSSGAALTGLQFVVMALVAETEMPNSATISAFGTPTIVHFGAVLLISAILSAPWPSLWGPSLALGACGVTGVVYGAIVVRRAQRQTGYKPVLEDWLWHAVFPLVAYGVLLLAAVLLARYPISMLFTIGASALLLLFIGIHNSWDTVTYVAVERRRAPDVPKATS